jgi:hypothetical protein
MRSPIHLACAALATLGILQLLPAGAAAAERPSMALVLIGPRNDNSWADAAYRGLQAEGGKGSEVAFAESVADADAARVMRGYVDQGYKVIVAHSFSCQDAVFPPCSSPDLLKLSPTLTGRRSLAHPPGIRRPHLRQGQGDKLMLVAGHHPEAPGLPVGFRLLDPLAGGRDEVPEQEPRPVHRRPSRGLPKHDGVDHGVRERDAQAWKPQRHRLARCSTGQAIFLERGRLRNLRPSKDFRQAQDVPKVRRTER